MAQSHLSSGIKSNVSHLGVGLGEARTTALVKGLQLEIARIVPLAGREMREHKAPGEITVQCLEGHLEFHMPDQVHSMRAGDFLYLDAGVAHSLLAVSDSSALVTMHIGKHT